MTKLYIVDVMGVGILATPLKYLLNLIHSSLRQLSVLKEKLKFLWVYWKQWYWVQTFFTEKIEKFFWTSTGSKFQSKKTSPSWLWIGYFLNRHLIHSLIFIMAHGSTMLGSLRNNNFMFCREETSLSERPSTTSTTFLLKFYFR